MMQWILQLLAAPILDKLLEGWKVKVAADSNKDKLAADLLARELLLDQREAELQHQYKVSIIGHWYEPTNLFGYIMVVYFGKAVLWDKVVSPIVTGQTGMTEAIAGNLGEWAGLIMTFYVGGRAVTASARAAIDAWVRK